MSEHTFFTRIVPLLECCLLTLEAEEVDLSILQSMEDMRVELAELGVAEEELERLEVALQEA